MSSRPQGVGRARWFAARALGRDAEVFFYYHPPAARTGHRSIYLYDRDGVDVGVLIWQVCDECRLGHIDKTSLVPERQRKGLGRRMVNRALRDGVGYRWCTSAQSPDAVPFFAVLGEETGVALPPDGRCPHLRQLERGLGPPRRRRPVLERDL